MRTLINPMVVCRETEQETHEYHQAIVNHIDQNTSPRGFGRFDSDAHAWKGRAVHDGPEHRALGGNIQIIGTPEQVTDYIVRLKQAGIDGIQLSFFDFKPDLTFFGARVLPLLKQLRESYIRGMNVSRPRLENFGFGLGLSRRRSDTGPSVSCVFA